MRQQRTWTFLRNSYALRVVLFVAVFAVGSAGMLRADITEPKLVVTSTPATTGTEKLNGGAVISLTATWKGDTPPYSATFTGAGGAAYGSSNGNTANASFQLSGAAVGHGDGKAFGVTIIETAVPNAVSQPATGDKTVNIDLIAPEVSVTIAPAPSGGAIFSNNAPNNVIDITVTSKEEIVTPVVTCSPAGCGVDPVGDTGNTSPSKSFKFKMTLSAAKGGSYTIQAVGKDNTLPATSANTGSGQSSFNVNVAGPSPANIASATPNSPSKINSVTLSGKVSTGMVSVEVTGAGQTLTANPSGENWSITVPNIPEGSNKFTVKGRDALGNLSAASSEFEVKVDSTAPNTPALKQPKSPTASQKVTIEGTAASDPLGGGVNSTPVKVNLYKQTTAAPATRAPEATVIANADGTFSFSDVTLAPGQNSFYVQAEDGANPVPGNLSGFSVPVTIEYNTTAATGESVRIAAGASLASTSLPIAAPPPWFGPSNYQLEINFDKDMDKTIPVSVGFQPANGAEAVTTNGSWVASKSFLANITVPAGQAATYDGAAGLRLFDAKDTAGNVMTTRTLAPAFHVDTTPPVTTMTDQDKTIYISSTTTTFPISGVSTDGSSGVGYVEIATESFDTGASGTARIPIFNGTSTSWNYTLNGANLTPGRYKLYVYAGDQAQPRPNVEIPKNYRLVVVARNEPSVSRISLDDESEDILTHGNPAYIGSAPSKLTAVMIDGNNVGLNFDVPPTVFRLVHNPTNTTITGNYTNNGSTTLIFTFPTLTLNGTYTLTVRPYDKAGNAAATETTRIFVLDTTGPDQVSFDPASGTTVQNNYPPIAADQVWAYNSAEAAFGFTSSTMDVTYNGLTVGTQLPAASITALVWDLYGTTASHPSDQSGDGRYDVTVVPRDYLGNIGATVRSWFYLDTQPPAVTQTIPASGSWIGLDASSLTINLSDSPRDITTFHGAKVPGDASWNAGNGSGLDLTNSTFTCTALALPPVLGTVSGSGSMQIIRPKLTASDSTDGIASLSMSAEIADGVKLNGPNIRQVFYNYIFDFLRPEFTFSKPVDGGKYCKSHLSCEGFMTDRGDSTEAMVAYGEIRIASGAWTRVTTEDALPAKEATWTAVLDISALPEETYTVEGRCFDRAGNMSDADEEAANPEPTGVSIVIDRTPPVAPTLILPLNDYVTQNRGLRFKWSSVVDGNRYLFQVADDSGFNNVLNHLAMASYSGLLGQVTQITEGAFSVPKDGTYYWRVAALELCQDGYNISKFSETWRFVVDTVKPKILEVQPTPSTGNKITTGMVTFTIRFNEKMDNTVPPTVTLTSAGGQQMLIEQVTYKENTWTGTTVIPKDNSATYDGNAFLSISGAKDLAGNAMVTDASNMVVINTGPAFEVKLFSNPAHELEIMIVVRATEGLQGPPACTVTQNSTKIPVTLNFLKEKYYAGSYRINTEIPGKAYVDISGTDLYGMIGRASVQFTVADLSPEARVAVESTDGLATLSGTAGSVTKGTSLYILSRENLVAQTAKAPLAKVIPGLRTNLVHADALGADLTPVQTLEEIGPASVRLARCVWYSAKVSPIPSTIAADKVALYRQVGDGWQYVGGTLKNDRLTAQLPGFGAMALMADLKEPKLLRLSPSREAKIEDPCPLFEGAFSDQGSGIASNAIVLTIDGVPQPNVFLDAQGAFSYQVPHALPKGKHQVEIAVTDRAGNTIRQAFAVTTPGPFAIGEFMVYPNPSRGEHIWFAYNLEQKADELTMKIYDSAGHKVTEFETSDFAALASGKLRWDLTDNDGRKVSNGVYFYKVEAAKGGQTYKFRGKLAVLR